MTKMLLNGEILPHIHTGLFQPLSRSGYPIMAFYTYQVVSHISRERVEKDAEHIWGGKNKVEHQIHLGMRTRGTGRVNIEKRGKSFIIV